MFSHNDLGIEHVLVDPDSMAVTGILDWTDAVVVDPARDFGLICRGLGPEALDAALVAYPLAPAPAGLRDRAGFYARCSVFEDLACGLDNDQAAYVDRCLVSLGWLFPG